MEAATTVRDRHEQQIHARYRAMVRFNGVMFYGVAAASLLETAAPLHAERLARALADRPELAHWVEQVWWPERVAHGRALRSYLAGIWPEFDWDDAYQEFYEAYRPRYAYEACRRSTGIELLGLCANATQAAVFYRALGRCADDPALRELMQRAARDHVGYFDYFRRSFEGGGNRERIRFAASWRVLLACASTARDREVALAFQALDRCWNGQRAFVELDYGEFLRRMSVLIRHHARLGPVERLLFRPWGRPAAGAGSSMEAGAPAAPRVGPEPVRPVAYPA